MLGCVSDDSSDRPAAAPDSEPRLVAKASSSSFRLPGHGVLGESVMRSDLLRRGAARLFAATLVALLACGAWAQEDAREEGGAEAFAEDEADELADDGEDGEASESFTGVEVITVTAQKRAESLQEVPAAVSAISGGQLDEAGFTSVQDIQSLVPNMHYGQEQGSAKITIRGISSGQGTDQSTAVHIDGIYQNRARAITALTFFDLQRIEVLRGPQGTLYGRNATGGVMNIISNPPSQDFELFGDVQFGTYWQQMIRGVLNVPIAEDLAAFRASGYYENRDGYQKNFCDGRPGDDNDDPNTPNCNRPAGAGNDADDADDFGIRTQLKLTPGEVLDTTLRFSYLRKRGVGYGLKQEGLAPATVFLPLPPPLPQDQPIFAGATPNPENARHTYEDSSGDIDIETINGNADLLFSMPSMPFFGDTKLKALGSFTQFDDNEISDQDYSDLLIAQLDDTSRTREWVAELNWSSASDDDWGWLIGFFSLGTTGSRIVDAPSKLRLDLGVATITVDFPFYQTFDASAYSVAGFGNVWWDLTEALTFEMGFRYSHDWKESHLESPEQSVLSQPVFSAIDDPRKDHWGRPSGSASLKYQLTEETLVYGRFATGYKSGALNNEIALLGGGIIDPPNADPENIFALEGGLKNTLLDSRLLLNGTLFTYWYRDLQVSQLREATNIIQNAATARVWGMEFEATYRPIDPLTLTAQFAYLNSIYTDYAGCLDAKDFSIEDCTGNQLTRAPRFSGTFIAMYDFDFGRLGTVTPFGQIYASDKVFFRPTNEPADTQDAYFLLNFRLMWQSEGGRVGVDLFVDNVLDQDVATTKIVGSSLLGAPLLNAYDRPRTAGVRLNLAW